MKLKSLTQSKGERATKTILEERLEGTPLQAWGKVRLSSAIGQSPGEWLDPDLFDYLRGAELDYVVFERASPSKPVLAVEFDGAHHETDPTTHERDRKKNLLWRMAGLPLIRLRQTDVEPLYTRDSLLSYLVEVILAYKAEHEGAGQALAERNELKRHRLLEVWRMKNTLATRHRVVDEAESRRKDAEFIYGFAPAGARWGDDAGDTYEGQLTVCRVGTSTSDSTRGVHVISKSLTLRTHYKATAEARPPWPKDSFDLEALEAQAKWLETDPWYTPALPGVNWLYVASNLLQVLCLKQLLSDFEASRTGK